MSYRDASSPASAAMPAAPATRQLRWLALITVVSAVALDLLVRAVAFAVFDISNDFQPLAVAPVVLWSAVGAIGAVAVYALLRRASPRPVARFRGIAVVVLLLSLIPDLALLIAKPDRFDGITNSAIATLLVMHFVVAGVAIGILGTSPGDGSRSA